MKTLFLILFNVMIVLIQVFCLMISIISGEMLKSNIVYLANILDNWSVTPIKNVQLFDFECPINYEPLLLNKYAISCDFNLDRDFLDQKSSFSKVFKNEKNQTFCQERYSDFFYFQIKQKKECKPNKEKDCGIVDTLGNHFCVPNNNTCPINGIAIKHHQKGLPGSSSHSVVNKNLKNFDFMNLNSLPINNDYSLVTTNTHNDPSSYLVVDIDIIQDRAKKNLDCRLFLNKDSKNKPNNRIKSYLNRDNIMKADSILDDSDTFSYHDHLIEIEYRPYIGWRKECLRNKHSTPDNIEQLYENYKKLFENKQKLTIFSIIFTLVLNFILIYFFSLHMNLKNTSLYFYLILSQILFLFIIVPLLSTDIHIYNQVLKNQQSIDTFNCSDDVNNSKLKQIKRNLYYSYVMDCSMLFSLLLNLVISIIFVICLGKSKEDQNTNDSSSRN